MTDIDKKFITQLQGKNFVTFEGLLNAFHEDGGEAIETTIIKDEPLIIQATVRGKKGLFQGIGDANESNTGSQVSKHWIRMAETRAIARALRFYNNIGMCSSDEVSSDEIKEPVNVKEETVANTSIPDNPVCVKCKKIISSAVYEYAMKTYGIALCYDDQKNHKAN